MSELPRGWVEAPLEECVDILDSLRSPINNDERKSRVAGKCSNELFPYYGATGQVVGLSDKASQLTRSIFLSIPGALASTTSAHESAGVCACTASRSRIRGVVFQGTDGRIYWQEGPMVLGDVFGKSESA